MGSIMDIGGYFHWQIVIVTVMMGRVRIAQACVLVLPCESWQVMPVLHMLGIGQ